MPLRKEKSWPSTKRKHTNSLLEDGLVPTKVDGNFNEVLNDSSLNESSDNEENKKV